MHSGNYSRLNLSDFFKKKEPQPSSMFEAIIQYADKHTIDNVHLSFDSISSLSDLVELIENRYPNLKLENPKLSNIEYGGIVEDGNGDRYHKIVYFVFDMDAYINYKICSYFNFMDCDNNEQKEITNE